MHTALSTHTASGETWTIYRSRPVLPHMERILVVLIALFLIMDMFRGRGTARTYDSETIIAELFGTLLLATLPFAALWLTRRRTPPSFLLIASSGLEYHGPGIVIASSWANVQTLSRDRGQPALLLHEPAATALSRRYRRDRDAARRVPLARFNYTDHSCSSQRSASH